MKNTHFGKKHTQKFLTKMSEAQNGKSNRIYSKKAEKSLFSK